VLRVGGRPDDEPVGLAYDHGSGDAVAFDLATHEVIGRRVAPAPPRGSVHPLSTVDKHAKILWHAEVSEEQVLRGRPAAVRP